MKVWIDNDGDVVWHDSETSVLWTEYLEDGCRIIIPDQNYYQRIGTWMILK